MASVEAAKHQADTGAVSDAGTDGTGKAANPDSTVGSASLGGTGSDGRPDGKGNSIGHDGEGSDGRPGSTGNDAAAANSDGNKPAGTGGSRIAGGVTPHHLLAANMIAGFFRKLSDDTPKTIVVIGPNHKRIGFGGLQTSSSDWATPFGRLDADGEIVKMLVDKLNASENDSVMQEDHAVSALVPYIRYYLPDVRIVPILLHGNYSTADSIKLGKLLGKISAEAPGSIDIIASVDFSHYLDAGTAYKMDDITLKAIRNNDIPAISRMSNDNMDSPPSIITLLGAMGAAGAAGPETAGHSNSSDITGSGYDNTTSYFTMFFRYNDK
jgi:AmmeMemoRadiSam system protein B